ncbi:hypothetical protein [Jiangella alba]|uniref:Uncharacterized protein n=1 Tax=Jiangella alba TaxID=561176 RepID=A0A1H5PKL8_9ACTN|nr:hypothetical protein [Jiangella alba]SEF13768.1 hypothetical protein SAMN04488561_4468 [Jiangella alba]
MSQDALFEGINNAVKAVGVVLADSPEFHPVRWALAGAAMELEKAWSAAEAEFGTDRLFGE